MPETLTFTVLKRKARSGLIRLRRAPAQALGAVRNYKRTYRRLRFTRIVERMHLGVCTPCQYDCVSCAHQGMRYQFKNHHLSIADLQDFLRFTESSGYFIERLHITGPGEPLLWKHLREGLALMRASPSIGQIDVVTNGLELDRIDAAMWEHIDMLRVSLYPEAHHIRPKLDEIRRMHQAKVIVTTSDTFLSAPPPGVTASIPCICECRGPMYFDKKVFLFCGPPVFGAAQSKGVDLFSYPDMYRDIGPHYLEPSGESGAPLRPSKMRLAVANSVQKAGTHDLCRYCFSNKNRLRPSQPHVALPNRNR